MILCAIQLYCRRRLRRPDPGILNFTPREGNLKICDISVCHRRTSKMYVHIEELYVACQINGHCTAEARQMNTHTDCKTI